MRSRAIIAAAVVSAASLVGLGGSSAFADTATNAGTAPAQNYVTVQSGDYLAAIASRNNTTYIRIYDANNQIQDPNLIYPGEVLRIPAANEQLTDRSSQLSDNDQDVSPSTSASTPESVPTAAPVAEQPQTQVSTAPAVSSGSVWDELAQCESGGNWSIDTGNGFYGGLQFTLSSWQSVGGTGYPNQASRDEQIMRAEMLQARQGWGAWPVCSAKIGL